MLLCSMIPSFLFSAGTDSPSADSLRKATQPDSLATTTADTLLRAAVPMKSHGSIYLVNEARPYEVIRKEETLFIQYIGLTDILRSRLPAYPLMNGSYSQFAGLSFFGATVQGVGVSYNNRPLNDVSYGSYNLEQFSPEFMEQAEILTGTDAVVLGENSTGALINLQEIRYNTSVPYTRLFFTEGANNHITADGVFSKNFIRNMNFTFGFRAIGSDGRNENSSVDAWHVRGLLRWSPTEKITISLTENFTNHSLFLNGGIAGSDPFASLVTADVNYPDLVEKNFRHDIALNTSYIIDNDSINSLFIAASATNSEWQHSAEASNFDQDTTEGFRDRYITNRYGFTGYYNFRLDFFNLKAGGSFDYINSPKALFIDGYKGQSTSLFAHGKLNAADIIAVSFGARAMQTKDNTAVSFGAKADMRFLDWLGLNIDLSKSERLPSPNEGLSLKKETHLLAIAELQLMLEQAGMRLGAFYRSIDNPILNTPLYDSTGFLYTVKSANYDARAIAGAYAEGIITPLGESDYGSWKFIPVNLKMNLQYYYSSTDEQKDYHLPELYGSVSLYSHFKVSNSQALVGFAFEFLTNFQGEQFIPLNRLFIAADKYYKLMHGGITIFATLKLGEAYLRISYNNIESQMYYVPYYPIYGGNFRLQVAWAFFD